MRYQPTLAPQKIQLPVSGSLSMMSLMELTEEQIRQEAADCYARKIRQAEQMSNRELFFAGAELFDYACGISLAGLKHDYPELSDTELLEKLRGVIHDAA